MHYKRWQSRGTTDLMVREPFNDRFWSRVDRTDTCWLWTGSINKRGYGRFSNSEYDTAHAHRIAWILLRGPIPDGLTLDHVHDRCGNKHCVNPDHLEPVTLEENHRRWVATITHCVKGHEFTDDNTIVGSDGWRKCRICDRAKQRAANQKLTRDRRRGEPVPAGVSHGKASTYNTYACRCEDCKAAHREFYSSPERRAAAAARARRYQQRRREATNDA